MKQLIEYRANVNLATPEGVTALHVTTSTEAIKLLLDEAAGLEAKDEDLAAVVPFLFLFPGNSKKIIRNS